MSYNVQVMKGQAAWDQVEALEVANYPWGKDYTPETQAWFYREEGQGFHLKMRCAESNPRAEYTDDNNPVYKDSCMEFFVNFYPEQEGSGYINFEMNSNGALLCEYGQAGDRSYLKDQGIAYPKPSVTKGEDYWEIVLFIPDALIHIIYGQAEFSVGHVCKGNFYKCGDATHTAHYGCWNFIENECPAFHKPEFFGALIIK